MTSPAQLPRVAIFSLGGTIASTNVGAGNSADGVTPRLDANDLIAAVSQLRRFADVETRPFGEVPSGDLTLNDLAALATAIDQRFAAGAAGVVVTQCTDTMEESAFALELLVGAGRPVVVTGAMRNPIVAGADRPANSWLQFQRRHVGSARRRTDRH